MKKFGLLILGAMIVFACSKESDNTMYVKAKVKGLKKGTFYLQKQVDSAIVSVDSINVNGKDEFIMTDEVISPEVYYLTLGNSDKKIMFFGEKDTVTVQTQLDLFSVRGKISGSANQDLLDDFRGVQQKFSNQYLDLVKEDFEARQSGNQDSIDIVTKKIKNWERKKYLYTTNFAVNHGDYEVSPYIALTELVNANITLLDTVNKSLTPKIKESKYGKELDQFVNDIKNDPTQE